MREEILRWRKKQRTGSHSFTFQGARLRTIPGDVVECTRSALGSAVRHYDCLNPGADENTAAPLPEVEMKNLVMVQNADETWDIINPDNPSKPLNQHGLTKRSATSILGKLYPLLEKEEEKGSDE